MKTKILLFCNIIFLSCLLFVGCKKIIPLEETEKLSVKSIITGIKYNNTNADFVDDVPPAATINDEPYVSVMSSVVKGKDMLVSITVPKTVQELYFSVSNIDANYLNIDLENEAGDANTGYFKLDVRNLKKCKDITSKRLTENSKGTEEYVNYLVVLSTNENIEIDAFNLNIAYSSPSGISDIISTLINVLSVCPYQKMLKFAFRPIYDRTYTLIITNPDGTKVSYSYNKDNGLSNYNNSQAPLCTISYDSQLDLNWIELNPIFGKYNVDDEVLIELHGEDEYVYLLWVVLAMGEIDEIFPSVNLVGGPPLAIGYAHLSFKYFFQDVHVNMTAYRQITPYFNSLPIPEDKEEQPGVGIRKNGNDNDSNLIKVMLQVNPTIPPYGVIYRLKKDNQNICVFGNPDKTDPILTNTINQQDMIFTSGTQYIYVENTQIGNSNLVFEAIDTIDNSIISSDKIVFNSFTSIVIMIGGHGAPLPDINHTQGVYNLADDLYENWGYDVYKCKEDYGSQMGGGIDPIYNIIIDAKNNRNVSNVAIVGYSHGGGATYLVSHKLMNNSINITIPFTAYIDAICWYSGVSQDTIPCNSKLHLNYYQRTLVPMGNVSSISCGNNPNIINYNVSLWTIIPPIIHTTIHTNPQILLEIRNTLMANTTK